MGKVLTPWAEIEYSDAAKEFLKNLPKGQVGIVRARHVNGDKIQIEFAQKLDSPTTNRNAVSIFNASDARFSQNGPRRAWVSATAIDAMRIANISITDEESHKEILKPMGSFNGNSFSLQITEKLESELNENQKNNLNNYLKRAGKEGSFFHAENGERVAQIIDLVIVEPGKSVNHTYISGDYKSTANVVGSLIGETKKEADINI